MKLDATVLRYLTKDEWRVLTAVEMGMKNHELVPGQLIESIAGLKRGGTYKILQNLLKHKLLAHEGKTYDGYKLTYNGYDFLALKAFVSRGHLSGVGMRIGVGKESDIHVCVNEDGKKFALKLHRLGRVSFRSIKRNRDYLQHRTSASWLYLARLAAKKEYAYLQALYQNGFPVPVPVDHNRHAILMEFMQATPMLHVRQLSDPLLTGDQMLQLILRFAQAGLIHGDFNEFNMMLAEDEKIVVIDFPQVVSIEHENGKMYFDRDVECVKDYLRRKFCVHLESELSYEIALQAFRDNAPEEKAPEGGYDMPQKPAKVVVSLPVAEEKALGAALLAQREKTEESDATDDDLEDADGEDVGEDEAEERETDVAPPSPPRTAADPPFVAVELPPASASDSEGDASEESSEAEETEKVPRRVELGHVLKVKRRTRAEEAIRGAAKKQREKARAGNSSKARTKHQRQAASAMRDAMNY